MHKTVFLFFFCLLLGGCESFGRGFASEILHYSENIQVVNQECIATGYRVNGIAEEIKSPQPVKILMIHGIGTHYPGYSELLQQNLSFALGLDVFSTQGKNVELRNPERPQERLGNLRLTFMRDKGGNRRILFYELTWSEITAQQKKMLVYDYSGLYASRRVLFNETMKTYLDRSIPDAVFYMQDPRHLILKSAEQAMCWMAKSDWQDFAVNSGKVCQQTPEQELKSLADEKMLFITHSLGSKIFIDSFSREMERIKQAENAPQPHLRALARKVREKDLAVFMMANQLPLLQLWNEKAPINNQIKEYCRKGGAKAQSRFLKHLNIVAFNDPNDLLTYALEPDFINNYIDSRLCPRATNISVNVSGIVSALGLEIVNPIAAHIDYDKDPKVIKIISGGTENISQSDPPLCRMIYLEEEFK